MMPDLAPDMVPDINKCCWCQIVPDWASGICSGSVTEIVQHLFRKFAGYCAGYDAGISAECLRICCRNQYTADFSTGGRSIISSAGLATAYTHIRGFTGPREPESFGTLYPFLEWNHSVQCSVPTWVFSMTSGKLEKVYFAPMNPLVHSGPKMTE